MKSAYGINPDILHGAQPSGTLLECIPSEIPVVVTRRRTSRLSIRVTKEGEVRVSAPWYVPKREINAFVESHREWIDKALARVAVQQQGRDAFYSRLDISTAALRKEAAARLDAKVAPLVAEYSAQMGVAPAGIGYRPSKSRWGSCNPRSRRITFSHYLLLLPDWCIEHIVVHELAHLREANHCPRFYAIMDRYFPRWRDARLETRRLSR